MTFTRRVLATCTWYSFHVNESYLRPQNAINGKNEKWTSLTTVCNSVHQRGWVGENTKKTSRDELYQESTNKKGRDKTKNSFLPKLYTSKTWQLPQCNSCSLFFPTPRTPSSMGKMHQMRFKLSVLLMGFRSHCLHMCLKIYKTMINGKESFSMVVVYEKFYLKVLSNE